MQAVRRLKQSERPCGVEIRLALTLFWDINHIERHVDVKGRAYYWNHRTKKSSWLDPLKIEEGGGKMEREWTKDGGEYWIAYKTGRVSEPRAGLGRGCRFGPWWVLRSRVNCTEVSSRSDGHRGSCGPQ